MNKVKEQIQELRKLTPSELDAKLHEAKINYQDIAGQLAMGKIKTVSKLKSLKKDVARLATIKREKVILAEVTNG